MQTYENTKPLWRLFRETFNESVVFRVVCPRCFESIPEQYTRKGIPGGRWFCSECAKTWEMPRPTRKQVEERPRLRTRGIECDLEAIVAAAQRAAFSAGWTRDQWHRVENDLMREPLEEFDSRLSAWFDVVVN